MWDLQIKNSRKKQEECLLERDKSLVRSKYLESQLNKIQEDFGKLLNEQSQQHELTMNK